MWKLCRPLSLSYKKAACRSCVLDFESTVLEPSIPTWFAEKQTSFRVSFIAGASAATTGAACKSEINE
jgi:hypothetical protein